MDALLRYTLYRIAFSILFIELALMLLCCFAIIIIKLITKRKQKQQDKDQAEIRSLIDSYLLNNKSLETFHIPKKIGSFRNILESVETYDHLFTDKRWQDIKDKIVSQYLNPEVKRYASSYSWFKRQLAARALLLDSKNENPQILEKLLDDPRYLVRVAAATALLRTESKDLFEKAIKKMSLESPESQFPYRDALMQSDEQKFKWLLQLLQSTHDKKIQAICLDVLSTRTSGNLFPIVKSFIHDPDVKCRTFAIKALGNIPTIESKEILMQKLDDSDSHIRAESVMSLHKLYALEAIPKLQIALSDPVWWVRLQAALALKAFGEEGLKILNSKDLDKDSAAFEIAQYALAIP